MTDLQSSGLILSLDKEGNIHIKIPTDTDEGVKRLAQLVQGMHFAGDTEAARALCDMLARVDEFAHILKVVTRFNVDDQMELVQQVSSHLETLTANMCDNIEKNLADIVGETVH